MAAKSQPNYYFDFARVGDRSADGTGKKESILNRDYAEKLS